MVQPAGKTVHWVKKKFLVKVEIFWCEAIEQKCVILHGNVLSKEAKDPLTHFSEIMGSEATKAATDRSTHWMEKFRSQYSLPNVEHTQGAYAQGDCSRAIVVHTRGRSLASVQRREKLAEEIPHQIIFSSRQGKGLTSLWPCG